MRTHLISILAPVFASYLALGSAAHAFEDLTSVELLVMCQSDSPGEEKACLAYIHGFVDGAVATDPRVIENVVADMEESETFSERAMRTRLGITMDRFGPSYYADFCIADEMPVTEIRKVLLEETSSHSTADSPVSARDYVYRMLQLRYPCQTSE
jgi:hypothetical protein